MNISYNAFRNGFFVPSARGRRNRIAKTTHCITRRGNRRLGMKKGNGASLDGRHQRPAGAQTVVQYFTAEDRSKSRLYSLGSERHGNLLGRRTCSDICCLRRSSRRQKQLNNLDLLILRSNSVAVQGINLTGVRRGRLVAGIQLGRRARGARFAVQRQRRGKLVS